jgi:hypothetical protein
LGYAGSSIAVGTFAEPSRWEEKIVMHRIIVGVISTTLVFYTFGMAGGQAKNGDEVSSHPSFKVSNGSRANPNITLTELLDSYEKAVGGKEAIEKIQTVVAHEEISAESNHAGDELFGNCVEYFKSPNKAKNVVAMPSGRTGTTGYDGNVAWYDSPSGGIQQMSPKLSALAEQELNLFKLLHLRAAVPLITLEGSSKVEGRDVYVVNASIGSLGLHRDLFFDAKTRLLIGSAVVQLGAAQTLITAQFYSDFRVVNGVKFPFAVRAIQYNPQNSFVIKRTRIECNIPLGDDFFSVNSAKTAVKSGT